jgi:predicted lipoprotein with Yx(FWY)xxD motif
MKRIALVLATLAAAGSVFAQVPAKTSDGVLTNDAGMTLYVFDKDQGGKSACNGPCAKNWPPLAVAAGAKASGSYTVVAREDGTSQWAYKGRPLYAWAKDQKPGDKTGDGFLNGAWHVAKE